MESMREKDYKRCSQESEIRKNEWISKRRKPQRMNGNRKLKNEYMTTEKKTWTGDSGNIK